LGTAHTVSATPARAFLLIVVLALPLTLVLTFILSPFWNWFETASGVESLGHSGPANWCFLAVFLVVLALGWGTWRMVRHKKH
jgi:uncharacterized membrane protein YphA (DoxX/SURF4 family)